MRNMLYALASAGSALSLVGCSRNPNVEIVGSYFPGWMISLAIGIALTGIAHAVLRKKGMEHAIGQPVIIYPSMVLVFTCALWLLCFA